MHWNWNAQSINDAWCTLYAIRGSIDRHAELWVVALGGIGVIVSLLYRFASTREQRRDSDPSGMIDDMMAGDVDAIAARSKAIFRRLMRLNTLSLFVSTLVVLGAVGLLILPQPDYCAITASTAQYTAASLIGYVPVDPPTFSMVRPGFLLLEQESPDELVYSDHRQSWLRLWPGHHPLDNGYGELVRLYRQLKRGARNDLPEDASIETDRRPTEDTPFFILSWQTRDGTDIYECARLKKIEGKTYLGRFQVMAPAHNNPFTADNYRRMTESFLSDTPPKPMLPWQ